MTAEPAAGTALPSARSAPVTAGGAALIGPAYLVGALAAAAVAWWAAQRGVATDIWPAFVKNADNGTAITRYSGAWLTAAAGAALIAGLLLVAAVRRFLDGRAPAGPAPSAVGGGR